MRSRNAPPPPPRRVGRSSGPCILGSLGGKGGWTDAPRAAGPKLSGLPAGQKGAARAASERSLSAKALRPGSARSDSPMLRGAPLAQYPRLPLESPSRAPSGGALRPFGAPQWLLPGRRAAPSGRARLGAFCAELRLRTWPSTWCRSSWWAPRCWAAPSPARCGRSSQPAKRPPRHAGGRAPSPGPPPASPGSTCRKLSRSSTSPRSVRRRSRRTTSIYLR